MLALSLPFIAYAALSGSMEEEAIAKRLEPAAKISVDYKGGPASTATAVTGDVGKKRYEYTCKMCHETGVAGAPKFGDKGAWQARIQEGVDTLVKHVIGGYKAMPPKGGCLTCDDEEIKKTVEYMLSKVK